MDLYLVRHGEAKRADDDPERGLTDLGRRQAESTARRLAEAGRVVFQIRHSGKKRAEETAEIFAAHLAAEGGVVSVGGLSPNDDVGPIAHDLDLESEPVMIVGHLPFLPQLASALLAGDSKRVGFGMVEAAVLHLHKSEKRWYVLSMLTPAESGVR